ncbi:hypothetical protein M422DRAFT_783737 [Sphaerobolus stellatus SS14]|uniref:Squalene monooxygenase n=1 Tax=Sphaerobolus stellatus (strain SS14) TaxID=990650 RepID=A0A0C9V1U4_SPHS4|nr:hypothetical protein M422DRAFT_783737 [Sphaerobolus stellatus SS14]
MSLSTNLLYSYGWKLLAFYLVLKGFSTFVRRRFINSLTIMNDLPKLGLSRDGDKRIRGTAVICGGSLSGLLAARVCSDHFEHVVIVEPEEWLLSEDGLNPNIENAMNGKTINNPRARIPQWYSWKRRSLAGSKITPVEFIVHLAGRKLPWIQDITKKTIHITRNSLEAMIRRLVLRIRNVKQLSGRVVGLVGDRGRITGVKRRTVDGVEDVLSASLVVDCTGLATAGYYWLQDLLGSKTDASKRFASVKQTFNNKFAYVTCYFQVSDALLEEMDKAGIPNIKSRTLGTLFLPNLHIDTRALYHWSYEKNIIAITCSGYDMQEDINDIDDIRHFCDNMVMEVSLPKYHYTLLDILQRHNVPFSKYGIRTPHPVYIQYAKAKDLPSNFIAIGDAVMQVNAYKGQGIAKASTDVVTLNKLLLKIKSNWIPGNFGKTFFKLQASITGSLWDSYKSEDYTIATTVPVAGEDRLKEGAGLRKYMDHLYPVALEDPEVASTLLHVMSWTQPATDLFAPGVLLKILRHKIRTFF